MSFDDSDHESVGGVNPSRMLVGKAAALADWRHRKEKRDFAKVVARLCGRRRRHKIDAELRARRAARAREPEMIPVFAVACGICKAVIEWRLGCRRPTVHRCMDGWK